MFDFSKIKSQAPLNDLTLFQNQFTELQKSAIIGALIVLSKSDGEVHPKELTKIENTASLLGLDISIPSRINVFQSKIEMIAVLNTLKPSQKEWFLICLHEMVLIDGKVQEIEVAFALGFANDLGFNEDDYFRVIQKAAAIAENFRKN